MDKFITIAIFVSAIILISIYAVPVLRRREELNQSIIVTLVLHAVEAVVGISLILSFIWPEVRDYIENLSLYIFISGISLFFTSLNGIRKDLGLETTVLKSNNP